MAGWVNSTGTGSSSGGGGRGSRGRGFMNSRHTNNPSDMIHGGGRWRGDRPRGRPTPPPHYCYRPVNAAHRHSPPASLSEQQGASSTSSRHAQLTHPISTADKSPTSGTTAPSSTREQPDDKASRNAANFECNVCFDMAAEPVVTKCGHLFCWECLYQWLHVHSHHRECPICKGQVADDAIIPIYGRGGSAASVDNAPPRPTGARVESSRQQQQPPTFPHPTAYVDDDEDNPFHLAGMMNFELGAASIREAIMSFMPPSFADSEIEDHYGDFFDEYDIDDHDEVYEYDYHLMGFPVFGPPGAEAGNPSSSQAHVDMINIRNNIASAATSGYHQQEFGYSGANPRNRGRRGRRSRARTSADHPSTDGVVAGGSGAFYRDIGGSSNASAGASSRPNGGWAERRGRSNRNPNSASGRGGMQDSGRQRTNYN